MALLVCAGCSTAYAVGMDRCPHCGSGEQAEEGHMPMLPTIAVACPNDGCPASGRAQQIRLRPTGVGFVELPRLLCERCGHEPTVVNPWPPALQEDPMAKVTVHGGPSDANAGPGEPGYIELADQHDDEGVASSPGSSSPTSPEKQQTSDGPTSTVRQSPAPTTESRSNRGRAGSGTAGSTGGSTRGTGSGRRSS